MLTVPWTPLADVAPDREYVVMATRFRLSRRRHIPAFVRSAQAAWPAIARSAGLLGYSLDADLTRRTFCTLSAWRDGDAIEAFVRSEPHALVVAQTRPWLAGSTFVTWTVRGTQLPVDWKQVRERFRAAPDQAGLPRRTEVTEARGVGPDARARGGAAALR